MTDEKGLVERLNEYIRLLDEREDYNRGEMKNYPPGRGKERLQAENVGYTVAKAFLRRVFPEVK